MNEKGMESIYADALKVKPLRKFPAYFLDLFLAFVSTLVLFAVFESVMNLTPYVKERREEVNRISSSMMDTVVASGLGIEENGLLVSQDSYVSRQIKGMVHQSLLESKKDGISSETYRNVTPINQANDALFSYYADFKEKNLSGYGGNAKESCGAEYYRTELLLLSGRDLFVEQDYPEICLDAAEKVDEYYRNQDYVPGKEDYGRIDKALRTLLEKGIYDLQHNYRPYLEQNEEFLRKTDQLYLVKNMEILLSYFLGMAVVYLLFPLIFRDGRTPAFRILSFACTTKNGKRPGFVTNLLHWFWMCLESFLIVSLTAIVFFGSSAISWIGTPLFGNVSFLMLSVYSFFVLIISYTFCFAFRNTHQSLSEFLSMEIVRDSKMFVCQNKGREKHGRE